MISKKNVSIFIVIVWMILIFYMSSCDGGTSSSQSNFIVDIIVYLFNINNTSNISLIIRKMAHFTEYFILGLLLSNMFKYLNKNIFYSILIAIIYAISDEFHQAFVPGRYCSIIDMFIDSLGSISGIIVYYYLLLYFDKRKNLKEQI